MRRRVALQFCVGALRTYDMKERTSNNKGCENNHITIKTFLHYLSLIKQGSKYSYTVKKQLKNYAYHYLLYPMQVAHTVPFQNSDISELQFQMTSAIPHIKWIVTTICRNGIRFGSRVVVVTSLLR